MFFDCPLSQWLGEGGCLVRSLQGRMKRICRGWCSLLLLGCLDLGVSSPTLWRFQKRVTVILQSFHSACLSMCYPGDLPTPDAKREKVLWSNRGVVSAVKLELKYL